jgi:hypothetical protein
MADERDTQSGAATGGATEPVCPWCSAPAAIGAPRCGSCGAAIAQRESISGLSIPGVTTVDPNLVADSSPASPVLRTQGTTNVLFAATQVNATLGLAAAAAVLGQDTIRGMLGGNDVDPTKVGVPSEAALLAVERLERGEAPPSDRKAGDPPADKAPEPPDPWSDLPRG